MVLRAGREGDRGPRRCRRRRARHRRRTCRAVRAGRSRTSPSTPVTSTGGPPTIVETQATARVPFPEADSPWASADGWAQWLAVGRDAAARRAALGGAADRRSGPGAPAGPPAGGRGGCCTRRRCTGPTRNSRSGSPTRSSTRSSRPTASTSSCSTCRPRGARTRTSPSLPTGASLHLHATDTDGEWLIRFTDSGIAWERGHEKATVGDPRRRDVAAAVHLRAAARLGRRGSPSFGDASIPALWQEKTAL